MTIDLHEAPPDRPLCNAFAVNEMRAELDRPGPPGGAGDQGAPGDVTQVPPWAVPPRNRDHSDGCHSVESQSPMASSRGRRGQPAHGQGPVPRPCLGYGKDKRKAPQGGCPSTSEWRIYLVRQTVRPRKSNRGDVAERGDRRGMLKNGSAPTSSNRFRLCPEVFRSSMCEAECALRRTLKTPYPEARDSAAPVSSSTRMEPGIPISGRVRRWS